MRGALDGWRTWARASNINSLTTHWNAGSTLRELSGMIESTMQARLQCVVPHASCMMLICYNLYLEVRPKGDAQARNEISEIVCSQHYEELLMTWRRAAAVVAATTSVNTYARVC